MKAAVLAAILGAVSGNAHAAGSLSEQNEALFKRMKEVHGLGDDQIGKIRAIFQASGFAGQGNPDVTKHPMTREQCLDKAKAAGLDFANPENEKICGAKYMVPLVKKGQKPQAATACIDAFEFPNIPCEYPVVWTKAREAALVCEAAGKRLCDAGEWEGGCAGEMLDPSEDYAFGLVKGMGDNGAAFNAMRAQHNAKFGPSRAWSYGPAFKKGVCGQNSSKDGTCNGGEWKGCGSNTYPAGSFPDCKSASGVFDTNGNAAEHMNLPLNEGQMTSRGSKTLGHTEMKGSWFIWDKFQAHEDWCRWRAPYWHGSKVMDDHSHHNYHLSFRCCNDAALGKGGAKPAPAAAPASDAQGNADGGLVPEEK